MAPRQLGRALGMERQAGLLQLYGLREIGAGVGILSTHDPAPWLWGRVAGDLLDLATLAFGLNRHNPRRDNVGLALATVAAVTVVDVCCARALSMDAAAPRRALRDYSDRTGFPSGRARLRAAVDPA
jgi:hypothetical protein